MEEVGNTQKILFVLVIYGCEVEASVSLKTLIGLNSKRLADVFVYDNSPQPHNTHLPVLHYEHDPHNGGLGRAYNMACHYAMVHGYGWLLLLDQDTTFPPHALSAYEKAINDNPDCNLIAPRHKVSNGKYMSPTHYRWKASNLQATTPVGRVRFNDASPINSGILVSVESFGKVGGYADSVWLDFSDICFIERYKRLFPFYYVLPDVACQQAFSAFEQDEGKVFARFRIYLNCAHAFPCHTLGDRAALTFTTFRQTISKIIRRRSLKYLSAYWTVYVLGKFER